MFQKETKITTEKYTIEYEPGLRTYDDFNIGRKYYIAIIFENKVFKEVQFNFGVRIYNRQDWKILKAIAEKIEEIEKNYN